MECLCLLQNRQQLRLFLSWGYVSFLKKQNKQSDTNHALKCNTLIYFLDLGTSEIFE